MEKGLEKATTTGVPQGGPLSVVCSNVYLDKLDKELEQRGLRFTRYADDVLIFTKSEMAANRVMKSICSWLERKLFLKAITVTGLTPIDSMWQISVNFQNANSARTVRLF